MNKAYWEKKSAVYDDEIFDVLKNDKKKVITSIIKRIASPEKTIADVGCGIGKWLPLLASQFGKVIAIDLSEANINYACKRYKRLKNVTCFAGDMAKSLNGVNPVDAILCVNAVITSEHSKREAFFKNLSRSVMKNGYMVLLVPSFESTMYAEYMLDKINCKNGISRKRMSGSVDKVFFENLKHGVVNIDNVPTKHYLEEELIDTLRDFDFIVETIRKVEYGWNTEIDPAPKWLKAPYPWDWAVLAKKK